jgi:hypothetical protein
MRVLNHLNLCMKKANREERNRLNENFNGAIALPAENRPENVASAGSVIDPMADPSLQAALALFMSTWGVSKNAHTFFLFSFLL